MMNRLNHILDSHKRRHQLLQGMSRRLELLTSHLRDSLTVIKLALDPLESQKTHDLTSHALQESLGIIEKNEIKPLTYGESACRWIQLKEVIGPFLKELKPLFKNHKVHLSLRYPHNKVFFGDDLILRQILSTIAYFGISSFEEGVHFGLYLSVQEGYLIGIHEFRGKSNSVSNPLDEALFIENPSFFDLHERVQNQEGALSILGQDNHLEVALAWPLNEQ